jgi:hypothetical protein
MAWACDNTLARGASDLDPLLVVSIKGLGAGVVLSLTSAGDPWPLDARGWGLIVLAGGVGVGASLVLELLALRRIGAALNAGLFATGPAFGFVWSLSFLGEHSTAARASPVSSASSSHARRLRSENPGVNPHARTNGQTRLTGSAAHVRGRERRGRDRPPRILARR